MDIIVQHDRTKPDYADGGDSAARSGIMAMAGSQVDRLVLGLFEQESGVLVRHPKQTPYNDPRSFTRDQLLQYIAGFTQPYLRGVMSTTIPRRVFWSRLKAGFLCQNTNDLFLNPQPWYKRDILTPSHIGHLIQAAKLYYLYPFLIISYTWLLLDILWSTMVKPYDESNQIVAMCSVAGTWALKLYCGLHPDWKRPLIGYWSGWRDQEEIGKAIIIYIQGRI
jgi:hypothetical protein